MSKLTARQLEVLDMIISDCAQDVKDFEHREFTGKTVGEMHGILEAKIEALAKIVRELATPKSTKGRT